MQSLQTPVLPSTDRAGAPLVEALLRDHPGAWRRFLASFDGLLRARIHAATCRGPMVVTDEDRAEIRSILLASLLTQDKKRLRAFDPQRGLSFPSFIALLAERCAVDYVRAQMPHRRRQTAGGDDDAETTHRVPSPEELVARKQRVVRVLEAARSLPRRHREIFDLYYADGLDPEAIAARMGTSVQTVHSGRHKIEQHLSRALRRETRAKATARPCDGDARLAA